MTYPMTVHCKLLSLFAHTPYISHSRRLTHDNTRVANMPDKIPVLFNVVFYRCFIDNINININSNNNNNTNTTNNDTTNNANNTNT